MIDEAPSERALAASLSPRPRPGLARPGLAHVQVWGLTCGG